MPRRSRWSGATCTSTPSLSPGRPTAAEVRIRLQPRAKREEIVGERAGAIVVRVTAPPVDGRANEALCRLVAKRLRVAPSSVRVVRGLSSRDKVVAVEGVDQARLYEALINGA